MVDDEPAVCRLVARLLGRHGYRVETALTGAEATAALDRAREPPSILIADMILPDTEGSFVVQAVKTRHPDVPVVLVSGLPPEDLRAFDVVADAFLPKPFSADELLACVRALIG